MPISVAGSLASAASAGLTTLAFTPTNLGDVLCLGVKNVSSTVTIASVSGGGVTAWVKGSTFVDTFAAITTEIWIGSPVTSTSAATITVTFSGSVVGNTVELACREFTGFTVWSADGVGSGLSNTSSTVITYPTLTPAGSGELYVGYARVQGTPSAGATSGFVYASTANGNQYIYNVNVSGSVSPTGVTTAGVTTTVAVLVVPVPPVRRGSFNEQAIRRASMW